MRSYAAAVGTIILGAALSRTGAQAAEPVIAIHLGRGEYAPDVRVNGQRVQQLTIVGRAADIARALNARGNVVISNCECLLISGGTPDCVIRKSRQGPVPGRLRSIAKNTVRLIPSTNEFVAAYNALGQLQPPRPPGGGQPPAQSSAPKVVVGPCHIDKGCSIDGNVEVSTTGELKYSIGCANGIALEVSSDGAVDLKISGGKVTMAVPLSASVR
jgi:hypothetical protein